MIKLNVLKLGIKVRDRATALTGTVTHWLVNLNKEVYYIFQPQGLNPETGTPIDHLSLELARMQPSPEQFEEVEIPFEILGTTVTDIASGFTGMAIGFVRHINGCFHVVIQPQGVLERTNAPVRKVDFDLRQCEGEKIIQMNEEALKRSQVERPSPVSFGNLEHLPSTRSVLK